MKTYRIRPSVYLAGQISGLNWQNCTDWRDDVADAFRACGIDSFSPLRAKSYLRTESENDGVIDNTYEEHILSSQRGIFGRDYFDCINRDLLFVNFLGATRASLGTAMEIAWAYHADKPIVVCIEKEGNLNDHAMLMEASRFRVDNLKEGILVAKTILLPVGNHKEMDE